MWCNAFGCNDQGHNFAWFVPREFWRVLFIWKNKNCINIAPLTSDWRNNQQLCVFLWTQKTKYVPGVPGTCKPSKQIRRAVIRFLSYAICACASRQAFYRYKKCMIFLIILFLSERNVHLLRLKPGPVCQTFMGHDALVNCSCSVCSKSALTNVMQCDRLQWPTSSSVT